MAVPTHPALLGDSPALREARDVIDAVARTTCTVLVTGESGTGKEVFARALHAASDRGEGPFVALNCASIPDSMVEAELFGHARGSFTGAVTSRTGRIAASGGGTLFLDEVGDMPLAAQAKLLRVLQEQTIMPVGGDHEIAVDTRVVAATHRDLEQMVQAGSFRADLFFRLCVVPVRLPALRERGDDVLLLARHFASELAVRYGRPARPFDEDAERALLGHPWPGNVRELAHRIERAILLGRGVELGAADLQLIPPPPGELASGTQVRWPDRPGTGTLPPPFVEPPAGEELDLKRALERVERALIDQALARTNGNRTEAAALLGLNRTTLVEKMRKRAS